MKYLVKKAFFDSFEEAEAYRKHLNYPFIHCGEGEWLREMAQKNGIDDRNAMSDVDMNFHVLQCLTEY